MVQSLPADLKVFSLPQEGQQNSGGPIVPGVRKAGASPLAGPQRLLDGHGPSTFQERPFYGIEIAAVQAGCSECHESSEPASWRRSYSIDQLHQSWRLRVPDPCEDRYEL